jgi:2-polyprenyl-6-hydroxyphenyl methylase/3-demethylubiquinone-9 3-methyltransferase
MSTGNVDSREIERFDALAAHWWDPNGPLKPLHDLNPLRLDYVDRRAGLAGKRVLDVGCGGGLLAEGMANRGADVLGIDLSEAALEAPRARARVDVAISIGRSRRRLAAATPAERFDVVTCLELLARTGSGAQIGACARLARPGGDVFFRRSIAIPRPICSPSSPPSVLGWLPRGTHDYARPQALGDRHVGARARARARRLTGMHYDPIGNAGRSAPAST